MKAKTIIGRESRAIIGMQQKIISTQQGTISSQQRTILNLTRYICKEFNVQEDVYLRSRIRDLFENYKKEGGVL